jgi:hypothetical protein
MASLTETANQAAGKTVLYLPAAEIRDVNAAAKDKEFVQQLSKPTRNKRDDLKESRMFHCLAINQVWTAPVLRVCRVQVLHITKERVVKPTPMLYGPFMGMTPPTAPPPLPLQAVMKSFNLKCVTWPPPPADSIVIHWTRQIKEVVNHHDNADMAEGSGPLEEINFWKSRTVDLSGISDQLHRQDVRKVSEPLTHRV